MGSIHPATRFNIDRDYGALGHSRRADIVMINDNFDILNGYAWRMTEINQNLDSALNKVNLALSLMDKEAQGLANIIDTKAEVLWKLGRIDEAIKTIDEAIAIDPESDYYQSQKEKFSNSNL